MPYPENAPVRRRRQIFSDDEDDELEKRELGSLEHDGWFAEFIERITRVTRNIGARNRPPQLEASSTIVRMNPHVRRDLLLFRESDHVDRRLVARRPA